MRRVDFKWKKYESKDTALFYYSFKFYSHSGIFLGQIENMSEQLFQQTIINGRYRFKEKKRDCFMLSESELIAAVRLGLRKSTSIVNIQFAIAKIE